MSTADRERIVLLECRLEQLRSALDEARAEADRTRERLAEAAAREVDHARRFSFMHEELADARAEVLELHRRLDHENALRGELEGRLFESGPPTDMEELVRLRRELAQERQRGVASEQSLARLRTRVGELLSSRETVLNRVTEWQTLVREDEPEAVDLAEFIAELRGEILELERRGVLAEKREAGLRERLALYGIDPDANAADAARTAAELAEARASAARYAAAVAMAEALGVTSPAAGPEAALPAEGTAPSAAEAAASPAPAAPSELTGVPAPESAASAEEPAAPGPAAAPAPSEGPLPVAAADPPAPPPGSPRKGERRRRAADARKTETAAPDEESSGVTAAPAPGAAPPPLDPSPASMREPLPAATPASELAPTRTRQPRRERRSTHPAAEQLAAATTSAVRVELLLRLGRSGDAGAASALEEWTEASEFLVRAAAYEALGRLLEPDPEALEPLLRTGLADSDARVRRRVVLAAGTSRRLPIHALLEPLREDPDAQVRRVVREILRQAPGDPSRVQAASGRAP